MTSVNKWWTNSQHTSVTVLKSVSMLFFLHTIADDFRIGDTSLPTSSCLRLVELLLKKNKHMDFVIKSRKIVNGS